MNKYHEAMREAYPGWEPADISKMKADYSKHPTFWFYDPHPAIKH